MPYLGTITQNLRLVVPRCLSQPIGHPNSCQHLTLAHRDVQRQERYAVCGTGTAALLLGVGAHTHTHTHTHTQHTQMHARTRTSVWRVTGIIWQLLANTLNGSKERLQDHHLSTDCYNSISHNNIIFYIHYAGYSHASLYAYQLYASNYVGLPIMYIVTPFVYLSMCMMKYSTRLDSWPVIVYFKMLFIMTILFIRWHISFYCP